MNSLGFRFWRQIRNIIIGLFCATMTLSCAGEGNLLSEDKDHEARIKQEPWLSKSILRNKETLLAATSLDLTSLNEKELKAVRIGNLPNLSNTEWTYMLNILSENDWQVSLNKKAQSLLKSNCGSIAYKGDILKLAASEENTEVCISYEFKTLRASEAPKLCMLNLENYLIVPRKALYLGCVPEPHLPLTTFGDNNHATVSARCKFRQRVILHYPSCNHYHP